MRIFRGFPLFFTADRFIFEIDHKSDGSFLRSTINPRRELLGMGAYSRPVEIQRLVRSDVLLFMVTSQWRPDSDLERRCQGFVTPFVTRSGQVCKGSFISIKLNSTETGPG
ncbi:Uncharacterised protein r2_g1689 [Pycnogonum litorale]